MSSLSSKIESILFIANRPMSVKKLAEIVGASREDVTAAIDELSSVHGQERGVRLMRNGSDVQLATAPENSGMIRDFLKDETTGELTKPSLETLTVVAYRGPIAKAELEQIRGVNCSLILRNLMMRGLVEATSEGPAPTYRVTMEFLRFLGVANIENLPDYDKLRSHENIVKLLESAKKEPEA
ncbi:MAG: SMC-Scp complex subunit ScpB [Patescibacteria group bacterium]